jgi:hypothetical protein|uniref:Uncharacterized protein n=1 Tax=Siphoviridae sp. ctq1q8 TaxID=2826467 RepID=A0A8S5MFV9_9CAUD|nr:MAG TPA: hypothetical protein [Siphoviridae sp. ctq1q8]
MKMGFYEKDGKRVPEGEAFEYALEQIMTGDICDQDSFVEWFFRQEMRWHFYDEDEETETVDDMTQQHINREIHYLRRA